MKRIKVICIDSTLDEEQQPMEYAIYNIKNGKAKLEECSFEPNFFEEEMTEDYFDVEFSHNTQIDLS